MPPAVPLPVHRPTAGGAVRGRRARHAWCTGRWRPCSTCPPAERTIDTATELGQRAFDELERTDPASAEVVRSAPDAVDSIDVTALLAAYFALEDPRRLEPHARELGVSAQLVESFEVRGFIDRVDRTPDGAHPASSTTRPAAPPVRLRVQGDVPDALLRPRLVAHDR